MLSSKKIIRILRCSSRDFNSVFSYKGNIIKIVNHSKFDNIPVETPADLVLSDKLDKKQRVFTAKLTFSLRCDTDIRDKDVYIALAYDRTAYIIGSAERPFPIFETNQDITSSVSTSELRKVTVTYSSAQKIPYVLNSRILFK